MWVPIMRLQLQKRSTIKCCTICETKAEENEHEVTKKVESCNNIFAFSESGHAWSSQHFSVGPKDSTYLSMQVLLNFKFRGGLQTLCIS